MNKFITLICFFILLTGCNSVENGQAKSSDTFSVSADGFVSVAKISTSDPSSGNYTPELKSVFVTGKFVTLLKDVNFLSYDKKQQSSIFNSSSATVHEQIIIQTGNKESLSNIVEQLTLLTTHNE